MLNLCCNEGLGFPSFINVKKEHPLDGSLSRPYCGIHPSHVYRGCDYVVVVFQMSKHLVFRVCCIVKFLSHIEEKADCNHVQPYPLVMLSLVDWDS